MSEIKKIGMYTTDEILKFMTKGEDKSFLGRNMFNAMLFKIEELETQLQQKENIIKEVREYITYWHYRNDFRVNSFTTGVKEELLEILDKGE